MLIQVASFLRPVRVTLQRVCQCFMKESKWINMYVSEYGKYVYIYIYMQIHQLKAYIHTKDLSTIYIYI